VSTLFEVIAHEPL